MEQVVLKELEQVPIPCLRPLLIPSESAIVENEEVER